MSSFHFSFWPDAIFVAGAYLLGSISFAVIVSRVMGLSDPRSYGSGNPGATNVLRSGSKKAAILTLLLDALKGWVPVALARQAQGQGVLSEAIVGAIALAAFVGHVWPVFFGFKGGKGVATAAGVLLGLSPALGGLVLSVWLLVAAVTRYSSLAALTAAVAAPVVQIVLAGRVTVLTFPIACMSLILIARHQANIHKLLKGAESKIGSASAKRNEDQSVQ
jgi:glycerol-3-phosphate acyltransferase PlsY